MRGRAITLIVAVLAAVGGLTLLRLQPEELAPSGSAAPTPALAAAPFAAPGASAASASAPRATARERAADADRPIANQPLTPAVAGEGPVLLTFRAPERARVGETIDVTVDIDAERPFERIALAIRYDTRLLRARTTEEVDYGNAAIVRRFVVEEDADSRVIARFSSRDPGAPIWRSRSLGVVQLEALAPGHARLSIESVESFRGTRSLHHASSAGDRQIVIDP